MFLPIFIILIIASLLFLAALVSLIAFIINFIMNNVDSRRKSFKILISSTVILIVLIVIEIFLLSIGGRKIFDITIRKSSEVVSKGLALTAQGFEQN